jgi:TrmH family RNA methyltransferase
MNPTKLNWRVVLVRPRNPLNIGAAARSLANFGLKEMAVVAPFEPTWKEARTSAVGAGTVMAHARSVPDLIDAIGDSTVVIGTTTGARRKLDRDLLPLPELAAELRRRRARGSAALLFGSEKTGLGNDDLSHCHLLVRIPTSSDCPSMNLGQAVAVCVYELERAGLVEAKKTPNSTSRRLEIATAQSLEHLFERAEHVLEMSGYLQPLSREAMLLKLRQHLLDLKLSSRGARILGGVLAQVEWKLQNPSPANC